MPTVIFLLAAILAIAGGIGVIAFREPIYSVLSLVATMLALAVLYLLLNAQFLFIVQVIVYAGAVMVLFLFVIALLGPSREEWASRLPLQAPVGALGILALIGIIIALLYRSSYLKPTTSAIAQFNLGTIQTVGIQLFTTYLYPFELTSFLLLVAAVGAIYLSGRE